MTVAGVLRSFIDILFPSICATCSSPVGASSVPHFCKSCWSDFSLLPGALCPRCGTPFGSPEALTHSPAHACRSCREEPPEYDQALAVGQFEGSLRDAIHLFKYRPSRALGRPLGAWMAANVRLQPGIDLLMPVPLHTRRLRERGFNQALLLAHEIGRSHGIPLSFDTLARIRPTRPQVELSGKERVLNVAGAFALRKPGAVEGKSVLLVDDVFTTGATLNECARVLKGGGAERVLALTLARAI